MDKVLVLALDMDNINHYLLDGITRYTVTFSTELSKEQLYKVLAAEQAGEVRVELK